MSELNSIREKLLDGELKIKRREGQKSHVWERFGDVVKVDDKQFRLMCDVCEALYKFDSHKTLEFK
jgi:hypothetical protein